MIKLAGDEKMVQGTEAEYPENHLTVLEATFHILPARKVELPDQIALMRISDLPAHSKCMDSLAPAKFY
jgi:hypothetical protein